MAESDRPANSNGRALTKLGRLLQQPRTPEKQRDVEAVISGSMSTAEKIRLIQEIDDRSATEERYFGTSEPRREVRAGHTPQRNAPSSKSTSGPRRRPVMVKAPMRREPMVRFFFRHRPRIRQFGQLTKTLVPVLFPPSFRIHGGIPQYFSTVVQQRAADLSAILAQLIGNAWLYLTKRDYNLLIMLVDLCDSVVSARVPIHCYKRPTVLDRLSTVEARLLALMTDPEAVPRMVDAVATLSEHNRRRIRNLDEAQAYIRELLLPAPSRPSLVSILRALNMWRYRRYIEHDEIILEGIGSVVATDHFTCSEETAARIAEYIERLVKQLEALDHERKDILKVRTYVGRTDDGSVDQQPLATLAQIARSEQFEQLQSHPALLADGLLRGFIEHCAPLLREPVELEGAGSSRLFTPRTFENELDRLESVTESIYSASFELRSVTRDRYLELRHHKAAPIGSEAEFLIRLDTAIEIISTIRTQLVTVMSRQSPPTALSDYLPVDPLLASEADRPLPVHNVVTAPKQFAGRLLGEVMRELVGICYLLPFTFADRTVQRMLNREHAVERDIEKLLEQLERMDSRDHYVKIAALYR